MQRIAKDGLGLKVSGVYSIMYEYVKCIHNKQVDLFKQGFRNMRGICFRMRRASALGTLRFCISSSSTGLRNMDRRV
jgi:hypothetical protein